MIFFFYDSTLATPCNIVSTDHDYVVTFKHAHLWCAIAGLRPAYILNSTTNLYLYRNHSHTVLVQIFSFYILHLDASARRADISPRVRAAVEVPVEIHKVTTTITSFLHFL